MMLMCNKSINDVCAHQRHWPDLWCPQFILVWIFFIRHSVQCNFCQVLVPLGQVQNFIDLWPHTLIMPRFILTKYESDRSIMYIWPDLCDLEHVAENQTFVLLSYIYVWWWDHHSTFNMFYNPLFCVLIQIMQLRLLGM